MASPALKFSLNSVPLTTPLRRTMSGDTQLGAPAVPKCGNTPATVRVPGSSAGPARVPEGLEAPAQDRGPRLVGRTVGTRDPDEAPVLAVDDRARPKVKRGELLLCPDRARQEIQPLREAEGGPSRLGLDARLQVGTGTDLHPAAG